MIMARAAGFRHGPAMRRSYQAMGLVVLVGVAVAIRFSGLQDYVSFAALGREQAALRGFIAAQPVAAPLAFIALYAAIVTLSLPLGTVMSVGCGVLFGVLPGAAYAVLGAWLGAIAVFLLARTLLGDVLARRGGRLLERVRPGLEQDGFSTLLALRLIPVVPFWVMNLAPALAGMRLAPYALATVLGIIPATTVFVAIGAGLGDTLATGARPDLSVLFSARVLLPLLGLAALALLPVLWRRWRSRHA